MCDINNTTSGCLTDQQVWFPVDFQEKFSWKFSRICSFIDIYRAGSLTPGITLILLTQAIAQLKDIYQGLIAPISINPGLLQDVLLVHCKVQEFWVSQKISRRLLIFRISRRENYSSRFPGFSGVLDTLQNQSKGNALPFPFPLPLSFPSRHSCLFPRLPSLRSRPLKSS